MHHTILMSANNRPIDLVCAWIDAYYTHRDVEVVALAHPEIEIRPRAGQGERLYRGIEGVHSWLALGGGARSNIERFSTGVMDDGRVLAEATLDGLGVQAVFEIRDDRIARVTMYISDRELLERVGKIDGPPAAMMTRSITAT